MACVVFVCFHHFSWRMQHRGLNEYKYVHVYIFFNLIFPFLFSIVRRESAVSGAVNAPMEAVNAPMEAGS